MGSLGVGLDIFEGRNSTYIEDRDLAGTIYLVFEVNIVDDTIETNQASALLLPLRHKAPDAMSRRTGEITILEGSTVEKIVYEGLCILARLMGGGGISWWRIGD